MNPSDVCKKLILAARNIPPDERVPLAFEKRIMAKLAGRAPQDLWDLWGHALGRAAICCVLLALLSAAGSYYCSSSQAPESLSSEVQKTLFAAVDNTSDLGGDAR